jgi:hypothetical protein
MINIKEENGEIEYNEKNKYTAEGLIKKYHNETLTRKMLKSSIEKSPKLIQDHEAEKDITNNHINQIERKIEQFNKIFKKREINPEKELAKLREKYTDEELNKFSENVQEKEEYQVKDMGNHIERTIKYTNTQDELVILYASYFYNSLRFQEKIVSINKQIEKIHERTKAQETELEKIEESIKSIESYFKKKRQDINRLLEKYLTSREKSEKVAQEFPMKIGENGKTTN